MTIEIILEKDQAEALVTLVNTLFQKVFEQVEMGQDMCYSLVRISKR